LYRGDTVVIGDRSRRTIGNRRQKTTGTVIQQNIQRAIVLKDRKVWLAVFIKIAGCENIDSAIVGISYAR
jgi:hypothetical protein